MSHTVIVASANGASIEQVNAAKGRYLELIEDGLGGESQVIPCFRAWTKGVEHGIGSLSPTEDEQSGAWIRADHHAQLEAAKLLGSAKGFSFLFQVLHP